MKPVNGPAAPRKNKLECGDDTCVRYNEVIVRTVVFISKEIRTFQNCHKQMSASSSPNFSREPKPIPPSPRLVAPHGP